jgi:hypothetical protein
MAWTGSFELVESKLRPPSPRPGIVPRTALVDRLASHRAPVISVRLPGGSQLALGSRARPRLPVGLLRAQGRMVEVGVDELAMDRQEARASWRARVSGSPRRTWPSCTGRRRAGRSGCTSPRWLARRRDPGGAPRRNSPGITG